MLFDRCKQEIIGRQDEGFFVLAWETGSVMSFEEVINFALKNDHEQTRQINSSHKLL